MSFRTIVELNHDCSHRITANPADFLELLGRALASGDKRYWDDLKPYGVTQIVMCHHSTNRRVVLNVAGKDEDYKFG